MPELPWERHADSKIARGNVASSSRDHYFGQTFTCLCGAEYTIGEQSERDHFVWGGQGTRRWVGQCPIIWGVEGAVFILLKRGYTYAFLPGGDRVNTADFADVKLVGQ